MTFDPASARRVTGTVLSALAPLLLLLTACTSTPPNPEASAPSLDRYYQQKADFQPCQKPLDGTKIIVDGECGAVEVPLNYQEPDGEVAEIAVFKVPARGGDKIGSVFLNPGGPGYPGVGYAAMVSAALAESPVTERFDIVGFDPRGNQKLTYAGASYGTRLGPVYAEMFPQNVRVLVLDGAMDPHANTLQRREEQWASFQKAFEDIAAFCVAQGNCPLGDDVKGATAAYQQLARPLLDDPVPAGDNRELSFIAANDGIVTGLYAEALWPQVVAGLAELKTGRGDILLAMRDSYHGRLPTGQYADAVEANYAIDCLDEDRFTPSGTAELTTRTLAAAPFLDPGTPVQELPDWCQGWPTEPTLGFPYADDVKDLPPTLTVSVTGDALTPHAGGVSLAKTLGGSLLTVEGKQHGTMLAGNACVNAAVSAYLVDLKVPAEGATCRL